MVTTGIDKYDTPQSFNESWLHKNSSERIKWKDAIKDELATMEEK